jgi:hypothetical protein
MLTIDELMILIEALDTYSSGILNREFSTQLMEIQDKLNRMIQVQGDN